MFSRTDMIWIVPSALRSSGISAIPRAIRPATSFALERLAVEEEAPGRMRVLRHDHLEELGPPRAHQPVDPDDLARAQRQRHRVDRPPAARPRQRDLLGADATRWSSRAMGAFMRASSGSNSGREPATATRTG